MGEMTTFLGKTGGAQPNGPKKRYRKSLQQKMAAKALTEMMAIVAMGEIPGMRDLYSMLYDIIISFEMF